MADGKAVNASPKRKHPRLASALSGESACSSGVKYEPLATVIPAFFLHSSGTFAVSGASVSILEQASVSWGLHRNTCMRIDVADSVC